MNVGRFWRTLVPLKASQWLWRLGYALERRLPPWRAGHSPFSTSPAALVQPVPAIHVPPPPEPDTDSTAFLAQLSRGEFEFLNQCQTVGYDHPNWRLGPCLTDRLWTITLHYHQWVYRLAAQTAVGGVAGEQAGKLFANFLRSWLIDCDLQKPGSRNLAWNAYAVATRIGWWVRSIWALQPVWFTEENAELQQQLAHSLWQQASWLERHLEWDLRANHLLRDLVGLLWAGRFFQGARAARWLQKGTNLLLEQVEEQVLGDGGHFERSPMYHLDIMEDMLHAALLVDNEEAHERLCRTWQRMAGFTAWVRHPDGQIPLFNDAALNGAPAPQGMLTAGAQVFGLPEDTDLPRGGRHFPDYGLVVWQGSPWTVFFDVGPVGVDYQPGHAHADTLALECSYAGKRLFVDPGTYAYDHDDRRHYDRSTAAHNTVCVDEQDSSEVWHIFRVGRRARPQQVQVDFTECGMTASAAHDGYRHLAGRPIPWRQVQVGDDGTFHILDRVAGAGSHQVQAGLLLDPAWGAEAVTGGWLVTGPAGSLRITVRSAAALHLALEPAVYHPEFGRELTTTRLVWRCRGELPVTVETIVERR